MAHGGAGVLPRILFLLLIIAVLAAGGSLWFDYLGLIDVKDAYAPVFKFFGMGGRSKVEDPDSPGLLDSERLAKLMVSVDLRSEELQHREESLAGREQEILQQAAEIDEQRKALEDQEKSLTERMRQYDIKIENIRQNARNLNGMPPAKAVAILLQMNDQDMIDHLRMVEQLAQEAGEDSTVAYWLSLMPADRAATIQRKMAVKPKQG
ncbi:MAG: flagellar protein FlbB [Spirochaetales bacterium]|jgi:flagellar protein FlbB|nr:flagellar protein FlbB [Spirochaetales bacterium]